VEASPKADEPNVGGLPLLFVAMPFGTKREPSGRLKIDFDDVYERAIKPAAHLAHVDGFARTRSAAAESSTSRCTSDCCWRRS
jgi:hypothetical protein